MTRAAKATVNVGDAEVPAPVESFYVDKERRLVIRKIRLTSDRSAVSSLALPDAVSADVSQRALAATFDLAFLKAKAPPKAAAKSTQAVTVVDLFSGCGLMSLGVAEACRAVRRRFECALAMELNEQALAIYTANFSPLNAIRDDISKHVNGVLGAPQTKEESRLMRGVRHIDLLIGGPPCQGHSDLNNYTRRDDPKNRLYDRMARFAEISRPTHVIIENVSAAVHDKSRVVQRTISWLEHLGYHVDSGFVSVDKLGVPQKRRRHLVVASREKKPNIRLVVENYERQARTTKWALEDLLDVAPTGALDTPSNTTAVNRERIAYLFDHKLFELPDHMRPICHKNGGHSYKSVYGRLKWDEPAHTITSGFTSMGQGRYVHPKRRRTLTPHEAARLQFIPDYFRFDGLTSRTALAEMIGNAVPPKLSYVFALELLR